MLPKFQTGLIACEELGSSPLYWSGSSALGVSEDARILFWILRGPFVAQGAKGEAEYP